MKQLYALALGAAALALAALAVAPAQARPMNAGPAAQAPVDVMPAGGRGHVYVGGWYQSDWHRRHYRDHRDYRYGKKYHHQRYGNVRPFRNFARQLRHNGYHRFSRPTFYGRDRHWSPHYRVGAYDPRGRRVNLRICAYTGNILGWNHY